MIFTNPTKTKATKILQTSTDSSKSKEKKAQIQKPDHRFPFLVTNTTLYQRYNSELFHIRIYAVLHVNNGMVAKVML